MWDHTSEQKPFKKLKGFLFW